MAITVELQDMFSYSLLRVVLAVALVVIITVAGFIVLWIKKKQKKPEMINPVPVVTPVYNNQVKEKYYALINGLETKYREGKVSNRIAYQELSEITRHFVYEVTGIKVHHNTLDEIKKLNMPKLYVVIEECYAPEFSLDKNGNIYDTINKARMVIKEWY